MAYLKVGEKGGCCELFGSGISIVSREEVPGRIRLLLAVAPTRKPA